MGARRGTLVVVGCLLAACSSGGRTGLPKLTGPAAHDLPKLFVSRDDIGVVYRDPVGYDYRGTLGGPSATEDGSRSLMHVAEHTVILNENVAVFPDAETAKTWFDGFGHSGAVVDLPVKPPAGVEAVATGTEKGLTVNILSGRHTAVLIVVGALDSDLESILDSAYKRLGS